MNKLLTFFLSLLAVSLEAATITNWGSQLPTAAPVGTDIILMQKGGVTYYFTPNQLAANIATNANSGIQPPSTTLSNLSANTYKGYTNRIPNPNRSVLFNSNDVMQGDSALIYSNSMLNVGPHFNIGSGSGPTKMLTVNMDGNSLNSNIHGVHITGASGHTGTKFLVNLDTVSYFDGDLYGIFSHPRHSPGNSGDIIAIEGWLSDSPHTTNGAQGGYHASVIGHNQGDDAGFTDTVNFGVMAIARRADFNASLFAPIGDVVIYDRVGIGLYDRESDAGGVADLRAGIPILPNYPFHFLDRSTNAASESATNSSFYIEKRKWGNGVITENGAALYLRRAITNMGSINGNFITANNATSDVFTVSHLGNVAMAGLTAGPFYQNFDGIQSFGVSKAQGLITWDTGKAIFGSYSGNDTELWAGGAARATIKQTTGNFGINTTAPLDKFHVVGGIVQTNGGIWQHFSIGAPSAPAANTQGAVYWNDGTNICAVFRNSAGTLTTNKLSMTAWP